MPAIVFAAIQAAPLLIQAGMSLEQFVEWLIKTVQKGAPEQADWDYLHAQEDAARLVLNDTSKDVR